MDEVLAYIDSHESEFLSELATLCNQKSIGETGEGLRETAELIRLLYEGLGAEVRFSDPDSSIPIIYAEVQGESSRSILLYNHYDTLPAGDLSLWKSDPFVTEVRSGQIFARGISDNKGDIMSRIHAVRAFLESRGSLPLTVKFLLEGEEYSGSPNLPHYFATHSTELSADVALWEGGKVDASGRPIMYLGTKGLVGMRLTVEKQQQMHVMYGSIVENPAWRLTWALASLKGPDERILVKDFGADIREPMAIEIDLVHKMPYDEQMFSDSYGISEFLLGERGNALKSRFVLSPHCTICAINSGMSWVVPEKATAEIAFALVPNQDPHDIYDKVCAHLQRAGFDDINVELLGATPPSRTPLDSPFVRLASEALRRSFGKAPTIFPAMPGVSPSYLLSRASIPYAYVGVDWDGDNVHGPNENLRVSDYINGTKALCWLLELCASELDA